MGRTTGCCAVAAALMASLMAWAAAEPPQAGEDRRPEAVQVLDVTVISTNRLAVGTNVLPLASAVELVARQRDGFDVIAVHGDGRDETPLEGRASAVAQLARLGAPLLLVEQEGERAWREQPAATGIRTVRVGTDQFAALRRLWQPRERVAAETREPAVDLTVRLNTATGTYELDRVELGLLGRRVWLMHEQRGAEDGSGTVGFQLKREW